MNIVKKAVVFVVAFFSLQLSAGFAEDGNFVKFSKELSVRVIDNQTQHSAFKVFYANKDSLGLVSPLSKLLFDKSELLLQLDELLCLTCVKGEFLPIYIKSEGRVGGIAPGGFHGPYYLSMWLNYPMVCDDQKVIVSYVVENDKQAELGIRINPKGDCQILAISHVQILPLLE